MTAGHLDLPAPTTPPVTAAEDGRDPAWDVDPTVAQPLWDRLMRARAHSPIVSIAEDAVFRLYLPLARALAADSDPNRAESAGDPLRAEQAAELGLAKAILAWRHPDCTPFSAFARRAILHQIQQIPAARTPRRRPMAVPSRQRLLTN